MIYEIRRPASYGGSRRKHIESDPKLDIYNVHFVKITFSCSVISIFYITLGTSFFGFLKMHTSKLHKRILINLLLFQFKIKHHCKPQIIVFVSTTLQS